MFVFLREMPFELPRNVWTRENPSLPHMRLALIVTWESHETRPIAVIVIRESVNSPTRVIHTYICEYTCTDIQVYTYIIVIHNSLS